MLSAAAHRFVALDTDVVAPTHVRVIDGTAAPAKPDHTLIIRNGRIASIGNSATMQLPAGTMTMDFTGKSVIPGLVVTSPPLAPAPGRRPRLRESQS